MKNTSHEFSNMRLYSRDRKRLYLNETERDAFIEAAFCQPPLVRTFCLTLAYTGARLSEVRDLRKSDVQLEELSLSIRSLKKRSQHHVREVPIPRELALDLEIVHFGELSAAGPFLWSSAELPPSRSSCYRIVKKLMKKAGISGAHASPKGLRHGFGVLATKRGVQFHMLQKWMGHSSMNTTAIYATALGKEEREVARRMW